MSRLSSSPVINKSIAVAVLTCSNGLKVTLYDGGSAVKAACLERVHLADFTGIAVLAAPALFVC